MINKYIGIAKPFKSPETNKIRKSGEREGDLWGFEDPECTWWVHWLSGSAWGLKRSQTEWSVWNRDVLSLRGATLIQNPETKTRVAALIAFAKTCSTFRFLFKESWASVDQKVERGNDRNAGGILGQSAKLLKWKFKVYQRISVWILHRTVVCTLVRWGGASLVNVPSERSTFDQRPSSSQYGHVK